MNPNELKKLKEKAPLPIFLLVVLFVLPTFWLEPAREELNSILQSFDGDLKQARSLIHTRDDYNRKMVKFGRLNHELADLTKIVPLEEKLPSIIDSLHALAKKNHVILEEVIYDFRNEFESLSIPSYRLNMNLSADYSRIRSFLGEIEKMPVPLIISDLLLIDGARYMITMRLLVK